MAAREMAERETDLDNVYGDEADPAEGGMEKDGEGGFFDGMVDMVRGGMEKARGAGLPMGTGLKNIDINEVRMAASSHYKGLTEDQRKAADSLFKEMDKDNDDYISVEEFRTFLTQEGFQTENCDRVFRELDKDNSGTLDFHELVTFFYVLSYDVNKPQPSRANTGGPHRKAENDRPMEGANDGGRKSKRGLVSRLLVKIKEAYKLWVSE